MRQYDLGSEEGVLLMCVAEALLRIPDQETADKLIRDKLGEADWKRHMGQSDWCWSTLLTLGLDADPATLPIWPTPLSGDVHRGVQGLIFTASANQDPLGRAPGSTKIMGHQFVMAAPSTRQRSRPHKGDNCNYRYPFDMLVKAH